MSLLSKSRKICALSFLMALSGCLFVNPLSAHHSAAMLDLEKVLNLKGTVIKFRFTNPHVWIHFSVVDEDGETTVWRIEHVSPNILKRKGWKRNSFKPGDEVTITFYPAKSGDSKGGFIRAVKADGTLLGKPIPETDAKSD